MVLSMLRQDSSLEVSKDAPGRADARLFFEEIEKVNEPRRPDSGFSFFVDPGVPFFEDSQ
jgi:hypothetical protein